MSDGDETALRHVAAIVDAKARAKAFRRFMWNRWNQTRMVGESLLFDDEFQELADQRWRLNED